MKTVSLRRYVIGWAAMAAAASLALGGIDSFSGVLGGVAPIASGIAVAAVVDLLVFALMAHGLTRAPAQFLNLWLVSIIAKTSIFGAALALVALNGAIPLRGFAIALAGAFVLFSHHEAFTLAALADRSGPRSRDSSAGGGLIGAHG